VVAKHRVFFYIELWLIGKRKMFRKRNDVKRRLAREEYEREFVKNEQLKKMKAEAKRISVTDAVLYAADKNKTELMLTPFIPFRTLQRMLGLIWMSGCWMGLAIMFASWGGLGWSFVCFCMMALSIFFLICAMLSYLDA